MTTARGLLAVLSLVLLLAGGCAPKPPATPPRPAQMPPTAEVVAAHNTNARRIDRFWSSAEVELAWMDRRKGRKRSEQGDGHLILIMPDQLALTVGKLGNVMLWVGSNREGYWIFDLHGKRELYIGRHGGPAEQGGTGPLNWPVRALDMPMLLGIVPIEIASGSAEETPVDWHEGRYVLGSPGSRVRHFIDAGSGKVVRVELLDDAGKLRVVSELSRWEPLEQAGSPPGAWPEMASRIRITMPQDEGRMVLHLSGLTDGRERDRIDPRLFDLDRLVQMHKPEEVVRLDEPVVE